MALRGQETTSDHFEWSEFEIIIKNLEDKRNNKMLSLFLMGVYTGLLPSQVLSVKWGDVINRERIKSYNIKINPRLRAFFEKIYFGQDKGSYIIHNSRGGHISIQYANRIMKKIAISNNLAGSYSMHSLRKTMGRRVWFKNNFDYACIQQLTNFFSQPSSSHTKMYLNIEDKKLDEIHDVL